MAAFLVEEMECQDIFGLRYGRKQPEHVRAKCSKVAKYPTNTGDDGEGNRNDSETNRNDDVENLQLMKQVSGTGVYKMA